MPSSKLQHRVAQELQHRFFNWGIKENTRPAWLITNQGERLELDFYIEKLAVAVEVQGKQHFEYTPIFHVDEFAFKEQVRRDETKRQLCQNAGIELFYICRIGDIPEVLYKIQCLFDDRLSSRWSDEWTDRPMFQRTWFPEKPKQNASMKKYIGALMSVCAMLQNMDRLGFEYLEKPRRKRKFKRGVNSLMNYLKYKDNHNIQITELQRLAIVRAAKIAHQLI